jgi:hypothetical protein
MSTSKQWFMTAAETHLSIVLREAADRDLQLYEASKLRYRRTQGIGRVVAADKPSNKTEE